ncbi:hypothetical protein BP6252_11498 [Coleophoma cylindrospora]|uniref:DUF8035 domain-containing protein n=1 Tax=Coleophoma cylindrospora TaxID=1849047 RepID=A0A3D8QJT2_9HELO|nr:hypothetical protein BP6252_11498 [Coleophoma cylindrospora]
MSVRGGPRRVAEYEERDTYYRDEAPPVRAPVRTREREETDIYTRRDTRPAFLQDDYSRAEGGPLVLRQRDTETYSRPPRPRSLSPVRRVTETREVVRRDRSPSPVRRVTESREVFRRERSPSPVRRVVESREVLRRERSLSPVRSVARERFTQRSPSPPYREERFRERVVERESSMPPPPDRLTRRVVETREIRRERSPSPVRIRERIIERTRTPSPPPTERVRTRIVEREETRPSPPSLSPSPSPPPPIVRAPPIHQEIITHHRHIDHGFVSERPKVPSPPPPPRSAVGRSKETEIDIYTSRGNTEVDITKTTRNLSPEPPRRRRQEFFEEETYESERDKLRIKDTQVALTRRRSVDSRSDFGLRERERERVRVDIRDDDDEAAYYARKNAERAYIGEAYNGATKDWAIVDVPPGTERVRMDGAGGGSEEITWQRYNGVRRSKFIPEREREPVRERERERLSISDSHSGSGRENTNMEISIRTDNRREGGGGVYEREYERIEESSGNMDRRVGLPRGPRNRVGDLWTEITKDLVIREAIEEMGYDFEETEYFFYVIEYLRYDDVRQLVELSDRIRRERQYRIAQIARERERMEKREREREAYEREREEAWRSTRFDKYDDERIIEREIIYDGRGGRRYR